jgi:hypothetical protein
MFTLAPYYYDVRIDSSVDSAFPGVIVFEIYSLNYMNYLYDIGNETL